MATPIAKVKDFETYIGSVSDNAAPIVESLLIQGRSAIGTITNRNLESQQNVEQYNGNGKTKLQLRNYPITAVNTLTINNVVIPQSVSGGYGYKFSVGGDSIQLIGNYFSEGMDNIEIDYVAGYGDASGTNGKDLFPWPEDLKLALFMYVQTRYKERTRLGVGSESLAGQSVSYDSASGTGKAGMPTAANEIINRYKRRIPV